MTANDLYDQFVAGFAARKFSAGLLVAFIDFYEALDVPSLGAKSYEDVIAKFPKQATTSTGGRANTLIVARPGGATLSLRGFYDAAERYFRADEKRFDYPSCAPHATQAWIDYIPWLDALATFTQAELDELRARVVKYVLDTLVSQAFDPASVQTEPPLFRMLLESFEMKGPRREPTGAAYQGIVFGFLRADNPHLQIEISKVRTGSKRLQRVGDIDGWDGARLAVSAEVKQFELKPDDVPDLEAFANETGRRAALGIVAALSFKDDAREQIEGLGLKALTVEDLISIVELWDPLKQRTAVSSLIYYARHVEKNSSLSERIEKFLETAANSFTPLASATGAESIEAKGE